MRKLLLLLGLLIAWMAGRSSCRAAEDGLVAWWTFDHDRNGFVTDSARSPAMEDAISGEYSYANGVRGKCLRLDGYTTGIERPTSNAPALSDALTIEAWVAPQTYPWNWTPIVNQAGGMILPKSEPQAKPDLIHLKPGLAGAQFGDPSLDRPLGVLNLQATDCDWTGAMNDWSARWRGYLTAPASGEVTVQAEADLGVRLRIGNQPVIDGWDRYGARSGQILMEKGKQYPVVLEYRHDGGRSYLRLSWSWAGQPRIPVPISALGYDSRDERAAKQDIVPAAHLRPDLETRIFLGLDATGHLALKLDIDNKLQECISPNPLPLLKWSHVVGTFDQERGMALYINGRLAETRRVTGRLTPAQGGDFVLGRNIRRMGAANSERKASADWPSEMVFDGLMDEVRVLNRALSPTEVAARYAVTRPAQEQPLHWRVMPSGPKTLPDRFAAVYCRLRYDELWEAPWRVGDKADILVHFDQSPVRLIFWRGTGYIPAWVTENGRWMSDQSLERAGSGKSPLGCSEVMSDKQARYSRVSVVEDNDARIVIRWRYAISDISYAIFGANSPQDFGEWAEEYYVIYPDAVAVRHQILWTEHLSHEWQETIVLNQPGTRPEDNIDLDAMTFANVKGETRTYSWVTPPPRSKPPFPEPADITLQMVNLKSRYRPFIVFEPGSVLKPFSGAIRSQYSHFPWWNHWPVAQLANDGREAVAPDRPSHSSLSQSNKKVSANDKVPAIHKTGEDTYSIVTLVGMSDKPIADLVPLDRSWNHPPEIRFTGDGFAGGDYDKYQRAFVITCSNPGKPGVLNFELKASANSPLFDPAFVIRNWGGAGAEVEINGHTQSAGKDLRLGHEHRLGGSDLVLWIKKESSEPANVTVKPVPEQP